GARLYEAHRVLDAVVGDAILRIVVGADLLRARTRPHLGEPRRGLLGRLPLALGLVEARAQDSHRLVAVLQLRALVLHRDDDPGREVRDPHGRVRRVHRLTARTGRAEDVDLQVFLVELDVHVL